MAGPKSGFRISGCALTLALAGMLLAVFILFQPAKAPAPAIAAQPAQLASAAQSAPANASQPAGQGLQFPALTGRVVDAANVIPDDVEARLTGKLQALETQSGRQLVVTTLPSLGGYEISDYGYQLGRAWGIGAKDKNDGALLIIAPNERKLRIEVGYGLEGILTDGLSSLIINEKIVPLFKAGDMPGGIEAGVDALTAQLTLPEDQARIAAAQAESDKLASTGESFAPFFFFGLVFFLIFVVPAIARQMRSNGYRPKGLGPVILWSVADALANARTSSGSSSSFGGGGFSGGGGSFGGGGSSGSW
jgi:uncharacterized protein